LRPPGIPKLTDEGKFDFHAARTAYITFLLESGATVKEAQTLARHSTPTLTMNTYARTRDSRLIEVTEAIGKMLDFSKDYALFMHQEEEGGGAKENNVFEIKDLAHAQGDGGGGSRTRVRRCLESGIYARSP